MFCLDGGDRLWEIQHHRHHEVHHGAAPAINIELGTHSTILVYLYSHNFNIYFVDSERAWNSDYLLSPTDQTAPRSRACSSTARRPWRSRSPCSARGGSGGAGGSPGTACRTARPATCTARTRGRGTCPPPAGPACCGPRRGPGASTPRRASGRTPPRAPRAAAGPWASWRCRSGARRRSWPRPACPRWRPSRWARSPSCPATHTLSGATHVRVSWPSFPTRVPPRKMMKVCNFELFC